MATLLEVKNLHVNVEGRRVLRGVSLEVKPGEVHAVMGPNGSGKSTLAYTIAGRPGYEVVSGDILLEGESIVGLEPEERALRGVFLGFQEPPPLPGVRLSTLIAAATNKRLGVDNLSRAADPRVFRRLVEALQRVGLSPEYAQRELHVGFSGGEKKRAEMLQALLVDPKVVILDEPDSGLDVDGVRKIAELIRNLRDKGKAILLITHYPRLFNYPQ
jgi:Fe-S cluster assembly ATP-binding protein